MEKVYALVLAAGNGSRMGGEIAKQYRMLGERPVLCHTLAAFERSVADEVVLVVSAEAEEYAKKEIVEKYAFRKVKAVVPGGRTRCDSVYAGLRYLVEECGVGRDGLPDTGETVSVIPDGPIRSAGAIVLVHDGARPFVTKELIAKMAAAAEKTGAAIPAVPVKDTIKQVKDGFVTGTPERAGLYAVQTPQAFRVCLLWRAFEKYGRLAAAGVRGLPEITDDALLVERMLGKEIAAVEGDYHNIKLTTPEDLLLARAFLEEAGSRS